MEAAKTQVYAALTNEQPQFKGLISEIKVNATFLEEKGELLDASTYVYTSPIATDAENDAIKLDFKGEAGKSFLKIARNPNKA